MPDNSGPRLKRLAVARFCDTPPDTVRSGKTDLLWMPLLWAVLFCYTNPRLLTRLNDWVASLLNPVLQKQVPAANGFMSLKYLPTFKPIEPVTFWSVDTLKLHGYWMPAQTSCSDTTVIMGHGYCADLREMLGIAKPVRDAGYNVLLFDFRGHGKSQGRTTSMGYHEGRDIAGAIAYLREHRALHAEHIIYLGHSMGTAAMLLAPRSLKAYPDARAMMIHYLRGIILDAPYASLSRMAHRFLKDLAQINPDHALLCSIGNACSGPLHWMTQRIIQGMVCHGHRFLNMDLTLADMMPARQYVEHMPVNLPMMVLHGTADRITPYTEGVDVFDTLRRYNPHVRMVTLDGADHLSRDWSPVPGGVPYVSAVRGGERFMQAILMFLQRVRSTSSHLSSRV